MSRGEAFGASSASPGRGHRRRAALPLGPRTGTAWGARQLLRPPAPGMRWLFVRQRCPPPARCSRHFPGWFLRTTFAQFCLRPRLDSGTSPSLPPTAPSVPTQAPTDAGTPSRRRRARRHGPGRHLSPRSSRQGPAAATASPRPVTAPRPGAALLRPPGYKLPETRRRAGAAALAGSHSPGSHSTVPLAGPEPGPVPRRPRRTYLPSLERGAAAAFPASPQPTCGAGPRMRGAAQRPQRGGGGRCARGRRRPLAAGRG